VKKMEKVKVAMVGCGRISEVYREVFKTLKDKVEVKYSVDIDKERAEEFASHFNGCRAITDYKEILDSEVDIVHLATPHYLHPIMAIDFMNHKHHVLTEKPMAITLKDADDMIKTSDKNGVKLGVIFQTRYVKGCMELKKFIEEGKLGKILGARSYLSWSRPDSYYAESNWKGTWDKEGGGVLIDQAIHSLDRVQWLVGSNIQWIEGSMANRMHQVVRVEDVAEALVKFENGCLYQLYACNAYPINAPIEIEIVGEKGKVGLVQDLAWVELEGQERYEIHEGYDGLYVGPSYWGSSHITQIKDFYKSVMEDKPVAIDGREGRKALELVLGIYKSAREHKRIDLPFED
jgi:UDP-N-acetyl-2-amino-2-deoxyglucuronate dehydrogenase